VEFLGYNPLLPSVDIYLKADYANNDSIQLITAQLMSNNLVKEVIYQKSLIQIVDQNIQKISLVILSFTIILLVVSVALINNTIRLAIHSQRFLIKSMQLVGATKGFIRKPFMKYSIIHGLLAGIIAIALLLLTLYFTQEQIPEIRTLSNWPEFSIVFALDVGIGVLISVLSTYFAVSRYLRLHIYDLYR
jgi:cell division transport system permease protein